MAYVIGGDCISCGSCADGCPVGAISEGDGKYVIDADSALIAVHVQTAVLLKQSAKAESGT